MRVNIYIDGFNLFYGSVKGTPYKWLDCDKMCRLLLPNHQINIIKYFTAEVRARPHDPQQLIRQQAYLRALRTIPNLEIILGHFLTSEVTMPIAGSPVNAPQYIRVVKTEEKGSDVNIATHLLMDGVKNDYEMAVLVTNDSDLLEPIKVVRNELNLPVGLLNPHKRPSRALLPHVTFIKQIRKGVLAASQFPSTMTDKQGAFHKPASW
ncbi:MAG: NYN domain-containing protein [Blastocatellia bacterium]